VDGTHVPAPGVSPHVALGSRPAVLLPTPRHDPAIPVRNLGPALTQSQGPAPTGVQGGSIPVLAPVQEAGVPVLAPTAITAAIAVTAAPQCPTGAGTLATGWIPSPTPVWVCLV